VTKDEKAKPKSVQVRKGAGLLEGIVTIAKSKEGVMGLYRGFGASMVNTFSTREYEVW
jgi:adenine nucleotide transporter 17